eukprot:7322438-Prorocentrum_lima.AAC.1
MSPRNCSPAWSCMGQIRCPGSSMTTCIPGVSFALACSHAVASTTAVCAISLMSLILVHG